MENKRNNSTTQSKVIDTITWHDIDLTVIYTINYFAGVDHIEIYSKNRIPFPISETGYRSHFLQPDGLREYASAVEFVFAWLDIEAESKEWKLHETASRQGDLFDL